MKDGSIMVIGIADGTGSGKTTITRKIMQHFGGNVSVIYHDNYYKAHHGMSYEERAKLNYDHPDAFDTIARQGLPWHEEFDKDIEFNV